MAALATRLLSSTQFYGRVALEFGKKVAQQERLAPPALDQWPAARQEIQAVWQQIRSKHVADYTPAQFGRGVMLGVEVFGFFVFGEILGRQQIVGYAH